MVTVKSLWHSIVSGWLLFRHLLLLLLLLLLLFFFTRGRYDPSGDIIVIIEYYCLEDQASSSIAEGKVPRKATRLLLLLLLETLIMHKNVNLRHNCHVKSLRCPDVWKPMKKIRKSEFLVFLKGSESKSNEQTLVDDPIPLGSNMECTRDGDSAASRHHQETHLQRSQTAGRDIWSDWKQVGVIPVRVL